MPTRVELDAIVNPILTQQGSSDRITGDEIRQARDADMDYVDQQDAAVASAAATDATTKADNAQAAAIAAIAGTSTSFNGTIKFDKILGRYATVNSSDISGAITVDFAGAVPLGCYYLMVVEDGGGEPSFSADFKFSDASEAYDTTDGKSTLYIFQKVGTTYHAGILQQGEAVVVPTLDTPSFSADAISDTEIDLNSITCDSDSEVMIIRRATNVGMSTGLITEYTGVPKSTHNSTGLTASTHYYYDVQTTAAGFTDSARATDDDTTDAAGLTPLAAPGNFILTVDEWGKITASWDNIAGETGFFVRLATNAGFTTGLLTASKSVNILSHQFTGLSPLTTYYGDVKAIGDGVTSADSAYSTTDSDTTPAATLNEATSFAAGTPTADGVPFTLVDTNSAPANESSALIQIALAADTTYSGTIITRTPAADVTSVAAGTGLAPSTAYRARHKYIGNGTSTLDSAYSSEVTFTTAASSSYDVDAQAYFTAHAAAGGTLSGTQKTEISNAFVQAKADGVFSKERVVYRMGGNVANACKINVVNPGTYDATFNGTLTVNDGIISDGTTGYVDSNFVATTEMASNYMAVSVFTDDPQITVANAKEFGATDPMGHIRLTLNEIPTIERAAYVAFYVNTQYFPATSLGYNNLYTVSGVTLADGSNGQMNFFEDSTQIDISPAQGTRPDVSMYFCAFNNAGVAQDFSVRKIKMMAIAEGVNPSAPAEIAAHAAFINALNNF